MPLKPKHRGELRVRQAEQGNRREGKARREEGRGGEGGQGKEGKGE